VKIFVSYSHRNPTLTAQIVSDDLNKLRHSVWFDSELPGGQPWWQRILREIRACDLFVLIVSTYSLGSPFCMAEFEYAHALGKPILPLEVPPRASKQTWPAHLKRHHSIWRKDPLYQEKLERALTEVEYSPKRELPNPLPREPEIPDDSVAVPGTIRMDASSAAVHHPSARIPNNFQSIWWFHPCVYGSGGSVLGLCTGLAGGAPSEDWSSLCALLLVYGSIGGALVGRSRSAWPALVFAMCGFLLMWSSLQDEVWPISSALTWGLAPGFVIGSVVGRCAS
jgi:hypothetical protein